MYEVGKAYRIVFEPERFGYFKVTHFVQTEQGELKSGCYFEVNKGDVTYFSNYMNNEVVKELGILSEGNTSSEEITVEMFNEKFVTAHYRMYMQAMGVEPSYNKPQEPGSTGIYIGKTKDNKMLMSFDRSLSWVSLTVPDAKMLAENMIKLADDISKNLQFPPISHN